MHSFARHNHRPTGQALTAETNGLILKGGWCYDLHELAALVADAGFSQVEMEEMRPPRFSAFPGASFVRAYKSSDARGRSEI
jgi:hypothetical protein